MWTRTVTLSLALLLGCSFSPAAPVDLPKAEAILDKFVAVTGGEAAYRKHHSKFSSGTVEIVGTGITGTFLGYHAEPNFSYMEMSFPTIGESRQGTDGDVAWVIPPSGGAKIKQGDERAMGIMAARGAITFIMRPDTFRFNEEPPKGIFDPPAEVKAPLGKQ
jgi:hypothetical protein